MYSEWRRAQNQLVSMSPLLVCVCPCRKQIPTNSWTWASPSSFALGQSQQRVPTGTTCSRETCSWLTWISSDVVQIEGRLAKLHTFESALKIFLEPTKRMRRSTKPQSACRRPSTSGGPMWRKDKAKKRTTCLMEQSSDGVEL